MDVQSRTALQSRQRQKTFRAVIEQEKLKLNWNIDTFVFIVLFEVFLLSVLFDKTTSSMTIGKQCWAVTRWRRRVSESTPEEVAVTRRHRSAKFAEVNFPSLRFGRRRRSFSGRLASFASDLCAPAIVDEISADRRLWSGNVGLQGYFEKKVKGRWLDLAKYLEEMGKDATGYLDTKYVKAFRVNHALFEALHGDTHCLWEKADTNYRSAISAEKRLAIVLYWLAHGPTQETLATLFSVGQSTVHNILHSGVTTLRSYLVKRSIVFPRGRELQRVMAGFKKLCKLPMCAGAMDGTFMKIVKPVVWGDSYWSYKSYPAVLILAVVDVDGIFTFVDAGRAASLGDAYVFNRSRLRKKLEDGSWLSDGITKLVSGQRIKPYLLADSAFGASQHVVKGFKHPPQPGRQTSFNSAVNQGRKVVETAFGRLKGRFRVLKSNFIRDPEFAAEVAMLCCALHNMCTRARVEFFDSWLPDPSDYVVEHGGADEPVEPEPVAVARGEAVRLALSTDAHLRRLRRR